MTKLSLQPVKVVNKYTFIALSSLAFFSVLSSSFFAKRARPVYRRRTRVPEQSRRACAAEEYRLYRARSEKVRGLAGSEGI